MFIPLYVNEWNKSTKLTKKDKKGLEIGDIRDSSFIAQESDNVLFVWRLKKENEAVLKIAKDRKKGTFNKIIPLIKVDHFLKEGQREGIQ